MIWVFVLVGGFLTVGLRGHDGLSATVRILLLTGVVLLYAYLTLARTSPV